MLQMPQNLKAHNGPKDIGVLRLERESDQLDIQQMYCQAFGPGRFARTAYRIRENGRDGSTYARHLSYVVEHQGRVVGTIRFSEISIGGTQGALLLGPLVVNEAYQGYNYGVALMKRSLELAKQAGFKLAILVGDLAYYQKAGFVRIGSGIITLPAPYDANRLLAFEIEAGSLQNYKGLIQVTNN